MTKQKLIPYFVLLVIATLLATVPVTWQTLRHVSACVQAPGCINQGKQPVGTLTARNYGFPATYRQVVSFQPDNNDQSLPNYAGYATASAETQGLNRALVVINCIFWFALLFVIYEHAPKLKRQR